MSDKTIKICGRHGDYPTPLIFTMVFPGSEYWCPYCGSREDIFGGEEIRPTVLLVRRLAKYKVASRDYLHAMAMLSCYRTKWEGEMIPPADLPQEEKDRLQKIREAGWPLQVKVEKTFKAAPTS